MRKLNFYPGPSKIYPFVGELYQEAIQEGLFEYNHRSPMFADIINNSVASIRAKLNIPNDYLITFVSSATECWQIVLQSFAKHNTTHFYNGAFGEKWAEKALLLEYETYDWGFAPESLPDIEEIKIPANTELIALTHNETSNGTMLPKEFLKRLRTKFDDQLIAIDATSSMAGINLNWNDGDIWFASVQKCFGLPAGMAVMVCSPNAIQRAKAINQQHYYNSFINILINAEKSQTTHTPNIPNIYLIGQVLNRIENASILENHIVKRAQMVYGFFDEETEVVKPLIKEESLRSPTVICLTAEEKIVREILTKAEEQNIILGKGYGFNKPTTFRIANFPAIDDQEIEELLSFFKRLKL